jgi:hypothetical protein
MAARQKGFPVQAAVSMPHHARRVGAKIVFAPGLHKDVIGAGDAEKRATLSNIFGICET